MMIALFPFKKDLITNKESIEGIFKEIQGKYLRNPSLDMSLTKLSSFKELEGSIDKNGFKIRRLLSFGYSAFTVIAEGKIVDEELTITYKFHLFVNGFILIAFLFFSFLSLSAFDFIRSLFAPASLYFILIVLFNIELFFLKNKLNIDT